MITQSINLNLIPGAVPPRIKVSQYDFGSRTLQFTLFNGTSHFTTASLTARIQGTKPDNHGFSYDATYDEGVVTADITRQMTACAGAVICELVIVDGSNNELGTGNFILDVEPSALSEDTDISDTEIPAIIDAAETNAERAEDAADRAEAASANPPYIGDNEHWYVWDTVQEQYVDSGVDAKGDDGATIVSVEKTSTSGYIDTYTITMSDGSTSTFTVTNGTSTLPGGGTKGQVLTKRSGTTGDADWSSDLEEGMEGLISSTVGWTGKNLLPMEHVTPDDVYNYVTISTDANGVVTANGTATGNIYLKFAWSKDVLVEGRSYILTGIETVDSDKYVLGADNLGNSGNNNYLSFTATAASMADNKAIYLMIKSGAVLDNVKFYPMLRDDCITDPTYEPHHKSVDECKYNRDEANVLGAKNLCPIKAKSVTNYNGIDATVAEDGKITFTNTTTSAFAFPLSYEGTASYAKCFPIPRGTYKISVDGAKNGFELHVRGYKTSTSSEITIADATSYTDGHTEATFTIDNDTTVIRVYFYLANNMACDNTVSVMIRLADDPDSAYMPYAMTNRAITQMFRIKTVTATTNANGNLTASDIGLSLANGEYIISASSPSNRSNASIVCEVATNDSTNRDWVIHCHDILSAENIASNLNVIINILYIKLP